MRRLRAVFAVWFLAFACLAQGATVRWTPRAQDVRAVKTITVTGTWAANDTATLTINNKSLTVTVGSSTSTTNIADILARMVDANSATEDLLGNETRNFGGEEIPEFGEIDASSSGAVLTLTSETPGVDFTLTRSEATAGDGALGAVTSVTAATGKNWANNAANYSGGAVPSDGDTLIFDKGSVGMLYGLTHFRTNSIALSIEILPTYSGQIGLPVLNTLGYEEYRDRYLQVYGANRYVIFPKGGNTTANGPIWVDLQDVTGASIIVSHARSGTITLAGAHTTTHTNTLEITKGTVSIEPDDAPSALSGSKQAAFAVITIGATGETPGPTVTIGKRAFVADAGTFTVNGGTLYLDDTTEDGGADVKIVQRGGVMELRHNGTFGDVEIQKGAVCHLIGAIDSDEFELFGGATLDGSRAVRAGAIAAVKMHAGSALHDPNGLFIDNYDLLGCTPGEVVLDLPANKNYALTDATP